MQVVGESKCSDVQRLREYAGYVRGAIDEIQGESNECESLRKAAINLIDAIDRLTKIDEPFHSLDSYRVKGTVNLPIDIEVGEKDARMLLHTHEGETDVTRLLMSVASVDPTIRYEMNRTVNNAMGAPLRQCV